MLGHAARVHTICLKATIKKANGYNNIPGKLLRLGRMHLKEPLTKLINDCMHVNQFPESLKCAEVSPLFKKDDNLKKENYRPVSVLTGISKLYEMVLNDQLSVYFNNVFEKLLSAFRKDHSFRYFCSMTLNVYLNY